MDFQIRIASATVLFLSPNQVLPQTPFADSFGVCNSSHTLLAPYAYPSECGSLCIAAWHFGGFRLYLTYYIG